MPTIGWLASRYDVALYQEDFEYHGILREQMPESRGERGNGIGFEPRLWAGKLVLLPFVLLVPHFSPPYGSGVSTFVSERLAVPDSAEHSPYTLCNGWWDENGDCWARKGWLRVRVRTPSGALVDVYNTHVEAGPSEASVATRRSQLDELAGAIERLSADAAVIAGGDFNVSFIRPGDRDMMAAFRERLGLADSGAGPELPFWRERDFILYRDGGGARLEVESAGEATEFVSHGRALSDHPALLARFRVHAPARRAP